MNTETHTPVPGDDRLEAALAEYLRAVEQGQPPQREEWLRQYPDLQDELAAFLDNRNLFEEHIHPSYGRPSVPSQFGDYELTQELGRGGMGIVFKARQISIGRTVALKMVLSGRLASPSEAMRFRLEAEAAAQLNHPHIVPLYEVGEVNGQLFFTMPLIDGGSLAEHVDRFPGDPGAAADLMAQIAEAVEVAHRHGIIHRDLKPGNILLDKGGVPHVTDFGLAIRLGSDQHLTESGAIVGTASYMAPEQAAGRKQDLTTAVDVYGLGVILYELLTGAPPFEGETTLETLRLVQEREPASIRLLNDRVDRDLEAICLKCLEKAPARRYAFAQKLADDLRRWRRGEQTEARPIGLPGRLWRWCRRHPERATFTAIALLLTLAALGVAAMIAQTRANQVEKETLNANLYAAQGVASTVLWHLYRQSTPVLDVANDPQLVSLLDRYARVKHQAENGPAQAELQRYVRAVGQQQGGQYQSWHILDGNGILLADSVENPRVIGEDFRKRDYFQGAVRRAGGTGLATIHVSRIYQSRNDNLHKIALAVAVPNRAGPPGSILGVVAATLTTTATLGSLHLDDERRKAVLVGRLDPGAEGEYVILLHPNYSRGVEARTHPDHDKRFPKLNRSRPGDEFSLSDPLQKYNPDDVTDSNYHDPVSDGTKERWLAGFAPVGNTELVVIVQQRYQDAVEREHTLVGVMTFFLGAALVITVLLIGASLRLQLRRLGPH